MKLYTVISVVLCAALLTNADHLHEIRVLTSNCADCGMAAFFGQLSVKVKYQCVLLLFFSADISEVWKKLLIQHWISKYLYP